MAVGTSLRALYFVLTGYFAGLRCLKPALATVLRFEGGKMMLVDAGRMPRLARLAVIESIMMVAIIASILVARCEPQTATEALPWASE